tara:strand:+ start:1436 stop:2026 length:591 start_codon:yes stop_codon:yes gene_type:complete
VKPEVAKPVQAKKYPPYLEGEAAWRAVERAELWLTEGKYLEVLDLLTHTDIAERQLYARATVATVVAWMRVPASMIAPLAPRHIFLHKRVGYLEFVVRDEPDNPRFVARLAEAYAYYPKRKAEARALLEDLAERGLMPDAFAYATLAQVRYDLGDRPGAREAIASCKKLDARKRLCSLTPQHLMPARALADETAAR